MKGNYKAAIAVLMLLTITSASAITEIGDNITVVNNVTAQNFLGSLDWAYLIGIPVDFPNATLAGYNGDFPNISVANIEGVNSAQNTSISNLQSNDTVHDSKISAIRSNETGYPKLDGSRTVTGSWNWGGFNLTNAFRVVAFFFEGDGSRLSNLNASNLTGTFNASTDARTNFPNSTVASKEASWDSKTTLTEVDQSANLYNVNANNITSGQIPSVYRLPAGTVILIDANETDSAKYCQTLSEITLMTFSLPANSYSNIIVESEVVMNNSVGGQVTTYTWRFNRSTTNVITHSYLISNTKSTYVLPLKTSFNGGQSSPTNLNFTGQMSISNAGVCMYAQSFRVYGVI